MNFCSRCGHALQEREIDGKVRPVCPACAAVVYRDPKVAVGVVAARAGAVLLTRRNHEPKMGQWSFPSGFVDAGEQVEEAAIREVREETGTEVRLDRLLGVFSETGNPVIFIAYAATVIDGEPVPGPECLAVEFFPPERMPELAFPHDGEILRRWATGGRCP
ncbi:MAG: NUDIX hydrolase [Chloroflexi bacterium]|nr:NUDIX hydrolase [Chloroflexota bacterium]